MATIGIVENHDLVRKIRILLQLGYEEGECEGRAVASTERVPEAGRMNRGCGIAEINGRIVDEDLIGRAGLPPQVLTLRIRDLQVRAKHGKKSVDAELARRKHLFGKLIEVFLGFTLLAFESLLLMQKAMVGITGFGDRRLVAGLACMQRPECGRFFGEVTALRGRLPLVDEQIGDPNAFVILSHLSHEAAILSQGLFEGGGGKNRFQRCGFLPARS